MRARDVGDEVADGRDRVGAAPRARAGRSEELLGDAARSRCRATPSPSGSSVPSDELGGSAADVDDQVGRRRVEVGRSRRGTTSAASSSPESSSGVDAERVERRRRRSRRGSSRRARRSWPWRARVRRRARRCAPRYSRRTSTVRVDRLGCERTGAVDALAEPGDAHPPVERVQLGVAAGAVDVGDEQARRVRPDVDRRDPCHRAPPRSCVNRRCIDPQLTPVGVARCVRPIRRRGRCRRRGTRRSGRGGTSRPCGSRPRHRADGGRRARRGARRRARPRTRRARPGAPSGSTAASAARTPPADSSRDTDTDSARSTSQ